MPHPEQPSREELAARNAELAARVAELLAVVAEQAQISYEAACQVLAAPVPSILVVCPGLVSMPPGLAGDWGVPDRAHALMAARYIVYLTDPNNEVQGNPRRLLDR